MLKVDTDCADYTDFYLLSVFICGMYLLNISGRPDRFFKDTRVKQEVLMKPVRSLPQVIEMLLWNQCPILR